MENERGVPTANAAHDVVEGYEAPSVEDLDGTFGPTVTAAGGGTVKEYAP